ncbi:MAG: TrkA C-terminal domain-containing protein [Buchananella hordeovulneris]|nr:TrkA C-terminal domain-containing protein [Buchananella hordeovulneris]
MQSLVDVLLASPLLTIFLVVALGSIVGSIPMGTMRLGASGALFVGLAVGAMDERLGEGLKTVEGIGLAVFVYGVGLAAGATFFRTLRKNLSFMGVTVLGLLVLAVVTYFAGPALGLSTGVTLGTYAGVMTSTPALSAASNAVPTAGPAVGFALAYPVSVLVAMPFITLALTRKWAGDKDVPSMSAAGLFATSVIIQGDREAHDVPGLTRNQVRISYLFRGGKTRVYRPGDSLKDGDWVVMVGPEPLVRRAILAIGQETDEHLADKRHEVDHLRFVVSSRAVIGRTIGQLDMPGRFGGVITRVRRGDVDLLARDNLVLEPGDRVLAVMPVGRMSEVADFIGDSEHKVGQIDPITTGLGIGLGLLVGMVAIPLGGGASLALGAAAGPLLVGMILGHFERTGPLIWQLPYGANLTIRQFGLIVFMACVGLAGGPAFAEKAFSVTGLKIIALSVALCVIGCLGFMYASKLLGLSPARIAGGLAGFIGQPALVESANLQCSDERIDDGYATHYALGIILKILVVSGLAVVL